jgi:hypothetical protein
MTGTARYAKESIVAVEQTFGAVKAEDLDIEQTFMLYASFCGDVVRTAHASGATTSQVIDLAQKNDWMGRIRELVELKKTDKPGVIEKEFSRAMNFVQAHRYRVYLERVLRKLIAMSEDDLFKFLVSDRIDKTGRVVGQVFSTRPLADFASALEKVHWMSYQALGDTPQDRLRAKEKPSDGELSETDVHARIAKAMAGMPSMCPAEHLKVAQQELGEHLATTGRKLVATAPPPVPATPPIPVNQDPLNTSS